METREHAERALEATNDAARTVRSLYIVFLVLGSYIGVIIAGTTDAQLLRVSPVRLPLLGVAVPLRGFYFIVPWLVVLLHSYLLVQLALLGGTLRTFVKWIGVLPEAEAAALRERLVHFPSIVMRGGSPDRLLRGVLALIVWGTLVAFPLGLLVWMQFAFLPFHSTPITWGQRAAVLIDSALLGVFWARIVSSRGTLDWWWQRLQRAWMWFTWPWVWSWALVRRVQHKPWRTLVTFSKGVQTEEGQGSALLVVTVLLALTAVVPATLWEGWVTRQGGPFGRHLDLKGGVLTANELPAETIIALREGGKEERAQALNKVLGIDLQGRDLRYANLHKAILPKADLRPDPQGRGKFWATLSRVEFPQADLLPDRIANPANLQGADLSEAQLQQAALWGVDFRGANLEYANLRGASPWGANFSGANLRYADLQKAVLGDADLQEAVLRGTNLQKAVLGGADLRGASLSYADLRKAVLGGADLRGASLSYADLREAVLEGANLRGASLKRADLGEAHFEGADLRGANLKHANLQGIVNPKENRIRGAVFERADLRDADFGEIRQWKSIESLSLANLYGIENPPAGFLAWAIGRKRALWIKETETWEQIRQGDPSRYEAWKRKWDQGIERYGSVEALVANWEPWGNKYRADPSSDSEGAQEGSQS